MKYSEATTGRIFVLRLENGEILHEAVERFARDKEIKAAFLIAVGGADDGSQLVVGPREADARPVKPLYHLLEGVHEAAAVGTIFPDEEGSPILHTHLACGRGEGTVTGCGREGVKVWEVLEVVVVELLGTKAVRRPDPSTGFKLLDPA